MENLVEYERQLEEKLEQDFTTLWQKGYTYKQISSKDMLNIPFNYAVTLRVKLKLEPRASNRYSREGKIQTPITDLEFIEGMKKGLFFHPKHKGLVALYYYTGVRKTEGIRALKEYFSLHDGNIIFSVGKRLKHGIETPPLEIPLNAPYANFIWASVEHTGAGQRVWPYSKRTAYNIVRRAFKYPHLFRLSRITTFFNEGWTIPEVRSWTGLTLSALNYYIGLVTVKKMGASLNKFGERKPIPLS